MFKKVLLPIDLHQPSSWQKALPAALEYCKAFGAELHLLTIFPDLPIEAYRLYLPEDTESRLAHEAASGLDAFAAEHVPAGIAVSKHVDTGSIYHCILETAERIGIDLIVMASHRPEMSDYLVGPNASRVVRHARISVLVIR
jgi:nucleotide-binding universal stress UspA family protein